jgi:hypothetical protein
MTVANSHSTGLVQSILVLEGEMSLAMVICKLSHRHAGIRRRDKIAKLFAREAQTRNPFRLISMRRHGFRVRLCEAPRNDGGEQG